MTKKQQLKLDRETDKYTRIALAIAAVIILLITLVVTSVKGYESNEQRTERLCKEYAQRDHEKELAPERWQKFKEQGIDPNTHWDWYTSCILHNTQAVAK